MPQGKPAGVPCINLAPDMSCRIFDSPARPQFCGTLQPTPEMCKNCREEALAYLTGLEKLTDPAGN